MADQTRKPKTKKDEEEQRAEDAEAKASSTDEIDELLDEIDEVLESNAEDFVRSYVQKGGQGLVPLALLGMDQPVWWTALLFVVIAFACSRRSARQPQ